MDDSATLSVMCWLIVLGYLSVPEAVWMGGWPGKRENANRCKRDSHSSVSLVFRGENKDSNA